MRKKKISVSVIIFVVFCFFVLFKALNKSNTYVPDTISGKKLLSFSAKKLLNNEQINSDVLFNENKIYLLNIWASWCAPCRDEHNILMQLSDNPSIEIIGLNYRDNLINAKKFINKLGNPYSEILIDKDGTISIALGAYGVPETFLLNNEGKVIYKHLGPLTKKIVRNEISPLLQ